MSAQLSAPNTMAASNTNHLSDSDSGRKKEIAARPTRNKRFALNILLKAPLSRGNSRREDRPLFSPAPVPIAPNLLAKTSLPGIPCRGFSTFLMYKVRNIPPADWNVKVAIVNRPPYERLPVFADVCPGEHAGYTVEGSGQGHNLWDEEPEEC